MICRQNCVYNPFIVYEISNLLNRIYTSIHNSWRKKGCIQSIFHPNDFSQWTKVNGEPVDIGWTIKKGVVHRNARGGDIITKEKFKDFDLTFEWKISEAGNSGIKYRTRKNLGLEYQVLDI